MKINEIIVESQVDEISLSGIGSKIKSGLGRAAQGAQKAIGGAAGVVHGTAQGAWDQAKAGYNSGYNWARGKSDTDSTTTSTSQTSTVGQTVVTPPSGTTSAAGTTPTPPGTNTAPSPTSPGTNTAPAPTAAASAPATTTTPAGTNTAPAPTAAASAPAPAAANKSQLAADPYNTYKQQMRGQTVPKSGAKPLPQKFVDQINKDLSVFAKGSKDWGVNVADKLVKYGNQGYDVSQLANQWNANAKLVDRMKEGFLYTSEYHQLCEILREHGVSWSDLGLQIRIVESVTDGVFFGYKKTSNSFNVVFN